MRGQEVRTGCNVQIRQNRAAFRRSRDFCELFLPPFCAGYLSSVLVSYLSPTD